MQSQIVKSLQIGRCAAIGQTNFFFQFIQSEVQKNTVLQMNKEENVDIFAFSAIRGKLLERERKRQFWDNIHRLPIFYSKD